jgi:uncharacterized damage-inducible protein DinB
MPQSITIEDLLAYTDEERAKWERWFPSQPAGALSATLQKAGRFPTVWHLMDHIFLVETRHTQRLKQDPNIPDQTGVAEHDVAGLFAYARTSRKELTRVAASMTPADAERVIEFKLRDQAYSFSARKLAFHILFHEIRHWAQIATAVRNAGLEPPGFHDFLFSTAVK